MRLKEIETEKVLWRLLRQISSPIVYSYRITHLFINLFIFFLFSFYFLFIFFLFSFYFLFIFFLFSFYFLFIFFLFSFFTSLSTVACPSDAAQIS
jgi:hypothetical protein